MNTQHFRIVALLGVVVLVSGAVAQNNCLDLNYLTGYVSVPHSPGLVPQAGFTVEAWFNWNAAAPGNGARRILSKDPDTGGCYDVVIGDPGRLSVGINTTSGFYYHEVPAFTVLVTSLVWHHVAVSYDNNIARIYYDGAFVDQFAGGGALVSAGGPLRIGNGYQNQFQWTGRLDEVRIWSVVRTTAEISSQRSFQLGWTPGLVSSWRFAGNLEDSVGSNDGVAVGTVPFSSAAPPLTVLLQAPSAAPIGSMLTYSIHSPYGGVPCLFDVSLSGTDPGFLLGSVPIPLNPPFLNLTYGGPWFNGFLGVLSPTGLASPFVQLPPVPALVGQALSACYLTLNAAGSQVTSVGSNVTTTLLNLAPQVANVSPSSGYHTGGASVTITGTNFLAGASVAFDGAPATGVVVLDSAHISCLTPPGTPGPADVTVTNPDGASGTAFSAFTFLTGLELTWLSPIAAQPGAPVTIFGAGFQPGLQISAGGLSVPVTSVAPNALVFTCPAGVPCDAAVTVTNPDNQSASLPFNPSPSISSLSSSQASAAGGSEVQVFGNWFFPFTSVTIGGSPAPVLEQTFTFLRLLVPSGSPGPTSLVLTTPQGCSSSVPFQYF